IIGRKERPTVRWAFATCGNVIVESRDQDLEGHFHVAGSRVHADVAEHTVKLFCLDWNVFLRNGQREPRSRDQVFRIFRQPWGTVVTSYVRYLNDLGRFKGGKVYPGDARGIVCVDEH